MHFLDIKLLFSDGSKTNADVITSFETQLHTNPEWVNHRCLLEKSYRGKDGETLLHLAITHHRLDVLVQLGILPKKSFDAKTPFFILSRFSSIYFERLLNTSYLSDTAVDRLMRDSRFNNEYLQPIQSWGGMTKNELTRINVLHAKKITQITHITAALDLARWCSRTCAAKRSHAAMFAPLSELISRDQSITWTLLGGIDFFKGLSINQQHWFFEEIPTYLRSPAGLALLMRSSTSLEMALDRILVLKKEYDGPAYNRDGLAEPYVRKPISLSRNPYFFQATAPRAAPTTRNDIMTSTTAPIIPIPLEPPTTTLPPVTTELEEVASIPPNPGRSCCSIL